MKSKFNLKMNILITFLIFLSIICVSVFLFNYYKSNTKNDFEDFFTLKNGKSEIEIVILDKDENKKYVKFVNSYDEVNKKLKSRIFYKQNNGYNEVTDIIYFDNDLYLNIRTILNNLKENDDLKNLLDKYYSNDEVTSILELFKKDYDNKYIVLNVDNLGLSNLIDSYNLLNENHLKKILIKISKNIVVEENKINISNEQLIKIVDFLDKYILENKNELFNIVIENSLYLNEKEFLEKPFIYRNIIEKYSNEIIDNKSDLILLLQNNQNFITIDMYNILHDYFQQLKEKIKTENFILNLKNNENITIRKNEKDFINIKINVKNNFENIEVPKNAIEYFKFINDFKEDFYNILGFNNNDKNNNLINSEWVNELNIDSINDEKIKEYVKSFVDVSSIDKYYFPVINETNDIYELSLFNDKQNKNNYILISFEKKNNNINIIEKLLSQEYDFQDFSERRLSYLIKFSEKYERIFKTSLDLESINKLFEKVINSNDQYVSDMLYNNNGYVYISFNRIDKTLVLRVIECNEN